MAADPRPPGGRSGTGNPPVFESQAAPVTKVKPLPNFTLFCKRGLGLVVI